MFSPDEFPESRIERERDFYHSNGYPLPIQCSGLVCVNAVNGDRGNVDVETVYACYARVLSRISDWVGKELEWAPVLDGQVLYELRSSDPGTCEIESLFGRLNVDWQKSGDLQDWNLQLSAEGEGFPFSNFETILSFEHASSMAHVPNLSVNLDADGNSPSIADMAGISDQISTLFTGIVRDMDADCASISPSRAAMLANGFRFTIDDDSDPVLAFPGWQTYMSGRVADRCGIDGLPPGFTASRYSDGVLIEFHDGIERFGANEANVLANCLDEDC
ncbi:hypothetical protein nbrc107696_20100 [Gordonia spumicola]|uniref:Uncharacterized protein n=2 Tax=Gordonia spumicola TaxID=589161 RepID=A0A7I9V8K0_9ACTN|nr:hypothetical protein nbrc107696_20100 [Gordonia spumicola]